MDITGSARLRKRGGFTLLEMAIVIIIIGVFTSGALMLGAGKVEEAKRAQTERKLDRLEEALDTYRSVNDRLPCPAVISAAENTASYGVEAAVRGRCNDAAAVMSTANGWAVAGAVPFKTLGLSEDFMYDGWDRRIHYAVDKRYTEAEAFTNYDIYYLTPYDTSPAACSALTVENPAASGGGPRSGTAIYLLMSHGENLHGAYERTGAIRKGTGAASADDLQNCKCDANGTLGAYNSTYRIGKFLLTFDDLGRYKERWQMQVLDDKRYQSYIGPELMAATASSPYVEFYTRNCEGYTGPQTLGVLAGPAWSTSISPNNRYWAVGHDNAPYVTIFLHNNDGTLTGGGATLDTAVEGNAHAVAFSPQGAYFAVGGEDTTAPANTTYLKIYGIASGSDTLTELIAPSGPQTQPSSQVNALAFSQTDLFLAVGHSDPGTYLSIYRNTNDVFDATTPVITGAPGGVVNSLAFSNDNRFLAAGSDGSPYLYVYSYNTTTSAFTKISDINFSNLPVSRVVSVSWSRDNRYLAAAVSNGASSIYVYRLDPSLLTLTQVAGPGTAYPTTSYGNANAVTISPRQNIIYHGGTAIGPNRFIGRMNFIPDEEIYYLADTAPYTQLSTTGSSVRALSVRHP